jgi:hypothetical protein
LLVFSKSTIVTTSLDNIQVYHISTVETYIPRSRFITLTNLNLFIYPTPSAPAGD